MSKHVSCAIISYDQAKAFDRVSHDYMFTVLRAYGFGDSFIKWVKLLYTDIHSRVLVNGFLSDPFAIERSIRQGCGLSMLLYVLCFEPLAHRIRLDPHIEGLRLPGSRDEARFSGYADDATTYTLSVQSIYKTVNLFSNFSLASGALLNRSKCQGLWIGTMPPEAQSCGITWVSNIKICGIYFGPEGDKMNSKNILDKLNKVVPLYKSAAMAMHSKVDLINTIFFLNCGIQDRVRYSIRTLSPNLISYCMDSCGKLLNGLAVKQ